MFSVNVFILNTLYLRYYISRYQSEKIYEVMIMYKPFGRILYGGDYNPNQWPKEVWEQDMAYFWKTGELGQALCRWPNLCRRP